MKPAGQGWVGPGRVGIMVVVLKRWWFLPGYEHTWEETRLVLSRGQPNSDEGQLLSQEAPTAPGEVPGLACPILQCCL